MKTRLFALIGALTLFVGQPLSARAQSSPTPAPQISAAAGILIDSRTGKILWAKDDQAQRAPASLTKIMTALVTLEHADLDKVVAVSREARHAPGARTYAEEGWTFTIRDLLWGLLLQSGNDAAIVLAQAVAPDGSVDTFARMMTERAAALGATNTRFANPHGYDQEGHLTTARDLAIIARAAMQNDTFAEMVRSKTHQVPWGDGGNHLYINHNKLLFRYPGTVGIKTGFTNAAGHCLASAVNRDGNTLIAILLGSPAHYEESRALYDWGFGNLEALRTGAGGAIQQVQTVKKKAPETKKLEGSDLEVVQLTADDLLKEGASNNESAPLLPPLMALLGATGISTVVVRSRRRRQRKVDLMSEFQKELDALRREIAVPEAVDA